MLQYVLVSQDDIKVMTRSRSISSGNHRCLCVHACARFKLEKKSLHMRAGQISPDVGCKRGMFAAPMFQLTHAVLWLENKGEGSPSDATADGR